MATRSALVSRQFNSPMKLYSPDNLADTMNHQAHILTNGDGIGYNQKMAAPGNLANSAVLRMLEESERGEKENKFIEKAKPRGRLLRFDWPPKGPNNNNINDDDINNNDDFNNNTDFSSSNRDKVVHGGRPRRHFFTTSIPIVTSPGLKRIAWPPPPENISTNGVQNSVYPKEPVFNTPISPSSNPSQQQSWNPNNPQLPANEPVFQTTYQTAAPIFVPPPTIVTLRQSAPVSQAPPPIFESQPAAKRPSGRMRGDEKWPPAENKAQAVAENDARKALAKGPACRPRAPKKDYSKFFAQHALANNYPGYRAPPGTQHYVEEGTSNF